MMVKNVLTIDWEDWYQGNPEIAYERADEFESRITLETKLILKILKKNKIKATFFLLGHLVEKYPKLVAQIAKDGHELASHGYSHRQLYYLSPRQFKDELEKTAKAIYKACGKKPVGFRASNWSINQSTWWAIRILKQVGYHYDSSIFPTKNYSYGMPKTPRFPYQHKNGLIEIPPSTIKIIGQNIPCCGGFFLRLWPSWFSVWAVNQLNRQKQPAIIHIHPWEVDKQQPINLPIPWLTKLIHYWNIKGTQKKLEKLISRRKFVTMKEYAEILKTNEKNS